MTFLRSLICLAIGLISVLAWTTFLDAHGGGLDAYGCHHNRKQGGYHCHRGEFAGQAFGSKEEMLRMLDKRKETTPQKTFPKGSQR